MILQRITKAVREQNWVAVALEFAIVVSGVAIGFLVTGLGEQAREDERARVILERLQDEFTDIEADAAAQIDILAERAELARGFVQTIVDGEEPDTPEAYLTLIGRAIGTPLPEGRSALYVELLATGDMALIEQNCLRTALIDFDEQVRQQELAYGSLARLVVENAGLLLATQSRLQVAVAARAPLVAMIDMPEPVDLAAAGQLMVSVNLINQRWNEGRREAAQAVLDALAQDCPA